jgi:hypothetical protein
MATSPIYSWPEPDNTDLVRNGALAIRTLGNAIDTTMGTMTPKSIVDAKGDLIAATANDTPARLAVGANGEYLVADSTTATGLRYTANFFAGKNKIINGDFGIWQRGTTFTNPANNAYTSDRWLVDYGAAIPTSNSITQQSFTAGTAPVAGYEGTFFLRNTITTLGTCNRISVMHRIEDVRTFANQTVTLSFYAKADSTRTLSGFIQQNFGSGGSATVSTSFSIGADVTTAWTRFTATIVIPSISGKTIGAGSYLQLRLDPQAVNGCVMDFWGVQIEAGSVATAFQTATGTVQGELAACQRYYYRNTGTSLFSYFSGGAASSTTAASVLFNMPVQMRVKPTSLDYGNVRLSDFVSGFTISALTLSTDGNSPSVATLDATGASGLTQYRPYFLGANNNTAAFVGVSAEL